MVRFGTGRHHIYKQEVNKIAEVMISESFRKMESIQ
jgi:hypothetical protein